LPLEFLLQQDELVAAMRRIDEDGRASVLPARKHREGHQQREE
jgi:hypothetical protein